MVRIIKKRDGQMVNFEPVKIAKPLPRLSGPQVGERMKHRQAGGKGGKKAG